MERARHTQLDRAPRTLLLGRHTRLVHRGVLAGDHDLAGTVVVRRPHVEDPPADALDGLVIETENCGHRAGMPLRSFGHRDPALANERERLLDPQRRCGDERGELAHGVPDHVVRRDPALANRRQYGKARADQRGLLQLGVDELDLRRFEGEPDQIEAGRLARALEDLHRLREGLGDLSPHAGFQRLLSGETEGDLPGHPRCPCSSRGLWAGRRQCPFGDPRTRSVVMRPSALSTRATRSPT